MADLAPPHVDPPSGGDHVLARPIVVLGPPESSQEVMKECLLLAPGTWDGSDTSPELLALGDNSHAREDISAIRAALAARFAGIDQSERPADASPRLLLTEPAASAGPSALLRVFPDAVFIYLHRDPTTRLSQLSETERASAVSEWVSTVTHVLDELESLPSDRWRAVDISELVDEPEDGVQQVFEFLDLGWHSSNSAPWRDLARQHGATGLPKEKGHAIQQLSPLLDRVASLTTRSAPSLAPTTAPGSLTAVDEGLGKVIKTLGCSLLVSTYQSDRVIALRVDGGGLGVHLRAFDRPMGIAVHDGGFALGTRAEVLDYRNFPAVAENLEPRGRHDACYLPRNSHVTGDVAIHDLVFGRDGLWIVATQFSCLATLDADHSFVPRWKPPFISELAAEDRCHLNGLCMVDGIPRFVTALGMSDTAGGWRANKVDGGVVMDVPSGNVVVSGLSMPHSPRWYDSRLWVLESGRGRLLVCDPTTGATETVAELPGFTRGLSFVGNVAFVATSQVRETATFGGLPILDLPRRECGVWAIDITSGQVLGSVRFEDRVREIFDVAALPGIRFPEVAEPASELTQKSWFVPPLPA